MKRTVILEIESSGPKTLDSTFEQAVLDSVEKGLRDASFTVTVKVAQPALAPTAPPKAA